MKKPSPSLVVAFIALFVALSGTTYAAVQIDGSQIADGTIATAELRDGAVSTPKLRRGAVSPSRIRNGAVSTPKLRNGAVTADKLAPGLRRRVLATGPAGGRGETGPEGPAGARGDTGPQGPAGSDATVDGIAAGGALTGTYPNPGIAPAAVETAGLAPGSVTGSRLALTKVADATSVFSQVVPGHGCAPSGQKGVPVPLGSLVIPVLVEGKFPAAVYLPVTTISDPDRFGVLICNSSPDDQNTGPYKIEYYALTR